MEEKEKYINSVNLNENTQFPYLVLDVINDDARPRNPGFHIMHWHEDLQFIYVREGMVEVQTLDDRVQVRAGEAFFINQEVVHFVRRRKECHYNSFIFPSYFLTFYTASPAKAMVERVTANKQFPFLHFVPEVEWHRRIIDLLGQLCEVEQRKDDFYPYEVLVRLVSIWLILEKNSLVPVAEKETVTNIRMRKMLQYIETHYGEDLTLSDLAGSAGISKSECARCFKTSLNTTPYQYLLEVRLSKAAQLLAQSEEPVGVIADRAGFRQMSHFGKCFKEKMGQTPREYRKKNRLES